MSRAPSTLPFPLEPYPSQPDQPPQSLPLPQQLKQRAQQNQRYVSNICRAGPTPLSRHSITDPICVILYFIFMIATITLYCINYFRGLSQFSSFSQMSLFQKLSYSIDQTLPQTMFTCACLFILGVVLVILVMVLYQIVGYLIILGCFALFAFIIYSLVALKWGDVAYGTTSRSHDNYQTQSNLFRICLIVIASLAAAFIIFLVLRRIKKLRHLGAMMGVVKVILQANLPHLPVIVLVVLNGLQMGIWCGFSRMFWNSNKMSITQSMPIPPTLVIIFVIVLWLWTHGVLLSISDYICESWVLHWYFKQKSQQPDSITKDAALKQNWRTLIIHKLFRYHLGTCIFGSFFSAYTSQNLLKLVRKLTKTHQIKSNFLQNIGYLSRYCYIQTVMEAFGYCQSNRQMYLLRKRIKQKIPEIYMLGHFLQEIMKLTLSIGALYLWFFFTYKASNFLGDTVVDFSPILFLLFCFVTTLGIFLEISTNISHIFGIISDTAVIAYAIDSQIERVHYDNNSPNSIPPKLKQMFIKLHIDSGMKVSNTTKNEQQANLYAGQAYSGKGNQYIGVSGIQH